MATIGRNNAIADFGFLRVSGYLGWLLWLFVHILFLIGFRNRALGDDAVGGGVFHASAQRPPDYAQSPG